MSLTAPTVKNSAQGTIEATPVVFVDSAGNYLDSLGGGSSTSLGAVANDAPPLWNEDDPASLSVDLTGLLRVKDAAAETSLAAIASTLATAAADTTPSAVKIDQTLDGTTNKVTLGSDIVNVQSAAPGTSLTVTITSGTSLSAAVDLNTMRLHRIVFPAGWDTAAMTFVGSYDGTNYNNLYDSNGEVTASYAGAARSVVIDPAVSFGIRYWKFRSGTAAAAVNQTADRLLTLVLVPR